MSIPSYRLTTPAFSKWILLPLRLFLGTTFIYAGVQKLTDPQFFAPSAPGYIGKQIIAFATGSPIHGFLLAVVAPHASLFGYLVSYGEIAIGLGALVGFLLRPAAFFGILISLLFFLSATWRVRPYFYGSDIVFIFCWLTLLLSGPLNTGYPSFDALWVPRLLTSVSLQNRAQLAAILSFVIGVAGQPEPEHMSYSGQQPDKQSARSQITRQKGKYMLALQARERRRNFLLGMLTGGISVLGLAWVWNTFHTGTGAETLPAPGTPTGAATASSGTPTSGGVIAKVSDVQNNSSVNFTLASSNDPGILVRLNNGQFLAYDAVCTHAG